jgi:hypothetical protein
MSPDGQDVNQWRVTDNYFCKQIFLAPTALRRLNAGRRTFNQATRAAYLSLSLSICYTKSPSVPTASLSPSYKETQNRISVTRLQPLVSGGGSKGTLHLFFSGLRIKFAVNITKKVDKITFLFFAFKW